MKTLDKIYINELEKNRQNQIKQAAFSIEQQIELINQNNSNFQNCILSAAPQEGNAANPSLKLLLLLSWFRKKGAPIKRQFANILRIKNVKMTKHGREKNLKIYTLLISLIWLHIKIMTIDV